MSEWICVDDVIVEIGGGYIDIDVESFMNAPIIEIIRCGECKHYKLNGACMRLDRKMLAVRPNDFCSYGEREGE